MEKRIKRVTIREIAAACNLSASTVSQILNNRDVNYSSQKTREMVLKTAEDMGYSPNLGYRLMHGQQTKMVALMLGEKRMIQDEYIQDVIRNLSFQLNQLDYGVYISHIEQDATKHKAQLEKLIQRGAEHFISVGCYIAKELQAILMAQYNVTFCGYSCTSMFSVQDDISSGTLNMLNYFKEKGCKNIHAIIFSGRDREKGIESFFCYDNIYDKENITILDKYRITNLPEDQYIDFMFKTGYEATDKILATHPEVDAILYYTDYFALGGAKRIIEANKIIGKDILLGGFNNVRAVQTYPYPISSVAQDIEKTVSLLIDNFETKETKIIEIAPIIYKR